MVHTRLWFSICFDLVEAGGIDCGSQVYKIISGNLSGTLIDYRVFKKKVFFQEFSAFCNLFLAGTGLLLGAQKMVTQ